MNEAKISVITPMYNCEQYILDCVRSVLNQTFEGCEHIIVDDCSTDRSVEVVEKIIAVLDANGGSIVKLLRHVKNTGQEEAINDGLAIARGKYIRVLHADDVFMPDALESLYDIAERTGADVVHENARLISKADGGATITPGCHLEINVHDRRPIDSLTVMSDDLNDRVTDWLERGTYVDIMYNLFRRDFFFDSDIRVKGSNFIFTFMWLMKAKHIVTVPQATYIYRINPESITNKKRSPKKIAGTIGAMIKSIKLMDDFMSTLDFFADKKYLRELIKMQTLSIIDSHSIHRHGYYREALTEEVYDEVERAMQKYFGEAGKFFAAYYFHIAHEAHFGRLLENEKLFREHTSAKYLMYPTF